MHFHEYAIDARSDCRAGQRGDEARLAAGSISLAARNLNAVRGVEDHRPSEIAHDLQTTHVYNQIVVAEGRATFGEPNVVVACGSHFFGGVADVVRGDK